MTELRPPKKSDTLEVRMPHEAKRAFLEACRAEGRTASEVVRDFVEDYLHRATRRERLRDNKPERTLAMISHARDFLLTPRGRRGALAAGVGALGLLAVGLSPSVAQVDFRAMFDRMDADGDGRITLEEFAAPSAPSGDVMMFIRTERAETVDGAVTENTDEFWLPAPPPSDAPAVGGQARHEVRIVRRLDGEEAVTEDFEVRPVGDATLIGLRQQEFARFDENADGAVDYTEFETRHTTMISNTFRRLDTNGDGALGADELDAIPVVLGFDGPLPTPAPGPIDRAGFARLDRDGDGAVTLDEFAAGPATP